MDARERVLHALEALRLAMSQLEDTLEPERLRALLKELLPLIDALDQCRSDEDWQRLRSRVEAFGTRHRIRPILDAPPRSRSHQEVLSPDRSLRSGYRGFDPGKPVAPRGGFELSAWFRRWIGPTRPAPIVTYPEVMVREEVVEKTTFRLEVTARAKPTTAGDRELVLQRSEEGPVDLEVEIALPEDRSITASCQLGQPLRVPEGRDSATLVFDLFAERPGTHAVTVRFRHQGIERLALQHRVHVLTLDEHQQSPASESRVRHSGPVRPGSAPFTGLLLRVDERTPYGASRSVRLTLTGLPGAPLEGLRELPAAAAAVLVELCRDMHNELDLAEVESRELRIQSMGAELADVLLPDSFRNALANLPEGTALHIEAEDPWVPWEMIRLGSAGFLGERFAVTRWLRRYSLWERFPGGRAVLVAPGDSGLQVEDERRALRDLVGHAPVELRTLLEVQRLLGAADRYGFLHFACHGLAEPAAPLDGRLVLQTHEHLRPLDVRAPQGGSAAPLEGAAVVLNACEAGIPGRGLSGHGGWADAFLRAGAGAFVAPSWSVGDRTAARFARAFYRRLEDGETFGEAARRARVDARRAGDPDRLAYAVYAAPGARLEDTRHAGARRGGAA
jgi:hypothetical protein